MRVYQGSRYLGLDKTIMQITFVCVCVFHSLFCFVEWNDRYRALVHVREKRPYAFC
jgi:hypothetical protein